VVSYTAWDLDGHLIFATNWDPAIFGGDPATWLNIPIKQSLDGGNIDIK
ncbi:MAG: hypothetical protein HKN80_05735, partial [Acidimicrobiia bacterium]|nr:hypothetical protein [Acidimicrobiia bacterium]